MADLLSLVAKIIVVLACLAEDAAAFDWQGDVASGDFTSESHPRDDNQFRKDEFRVLLGTVAVAKTGPCYTPRPFSTDLKKPVKRVGDLFLTFVGKDWAIFSILGSSFQQLAPGSRSTGRVISAEAWIHYTANPPDATLTEPPASPDWDFWCGAGALIPCGKAVGHKIWRLEKASGHGHLADWRMRSH